MAKRTDRHYTVLRQIGETIPSRLVPKLARAYRAHRVARDISSRSRVVLLASGGIHTSHRNQRCM